MDDKTIFLNGIKLFWKAKAAEKNYKKYIELEKILAKYELTYCDSVEEFENNFDMMSPEEATIFLEFYPDYKEYLVFAEKAPYGSVFKGYGYKAGKRC
ncbi:MAG: hypothetical protein AAF609_19480 [Cyanobacteria bacterium P01_C01_bin.120]